MSGRKLYIVHVHIYIYLYLISYIHYLISIIYLPCLSGFWTCEREKWHSCIGIIGMEDEGKEYG